MADLKRLLRIRRLEEQVAEEKLLEARTALLRSSTLLDRLREDLYSLQQARAGTLARGDQEGSAGGEQGWQLAQQLVSPVSRRLEQQRGHASSLQAAYADAHGERLRLDVLVEADSERARRAEQYQEQRRLDDIYLAGRAAKKGRRR